MTLLALALSPSFAADPPGEHARQAAIADELGERFHPRGIRPAFLPDATPGPDVIVYGYQAYWADDLNAVPWDQLSHVALFAAASDSSGNLTDTSRWDDAATAVEMAAPYGVKVHLCVTNFDTGSLEVFLGSASARDRLIAELGDWVRETGADGVNIDFEGLPSSRKQEMVDFTIALEAEVGEVVLATPAVDWSGAWDYSALSEHSHLFIMGYGYHWGGSDYAGPVDPLIGGDPWGTHSLSWTIDDYVSSDALPEKVILGLPLYGYSWPTSSGSVPAATTGGGTAIFWDDAKASAATYGEQWDDVSSTPYYYGGGRQGWFGNTESLRARVKHSVESGIGGIGFWALHYDGGDTEMWDMIAEETVMALPDHDELPNETGFVADAGAPFMAEVGDQVILSGAGSEGPDGVELEYRWTHISGPRIILSDERGVEPEFRVEAPGTIVFELLVGDGSEWSSPAYSYVIVIDKAAGTAHDKKGCQTAPAGLGAAILALLLMRRARK